MQPISALLALIPQPYRQFVELAFALIAVASMITGVLPASASKNPVVRAIRLIGGVVHSDEPGSIKFPFTNIVLRIGVSGGPSSGSGTAASGSEPSPTVTGSGPVAPSLRRVMYDGAVRMVLVALVLCASSCSAAQSATISTGASGTVTPDGTLTWQVGVSVAIQFARATIPPGLRSALESRPGVSADQRAAIDRGTALTGDSLAMLGTGWDSYVHHPTGPALCQAHVYLEQTIALALQTLQLLKDAGVPIPPIVAAAVGGLGPAADMLLPPCGGVTARRLSATDSIRAHLERLGSR